MKVAQVARMLAATAAIGIVARLDAAPRRVPPPVVGRWDITVRTPYGSYPSWLEVKASGHRTLVGYFVGRHGSVRPISEVHVAGSRVWFSLPPQWERGALWAPRDLSFEGRLAGHRIAGRTRTVQGRSYPFTAVRAPALERTGPPQWGEPVELFNGRDLSGWKPRHPTQPNGWVVRGGLLRNLRPANDLRTTRRPMDFRLIAEYRYPPGSNSGIYLRGRYEIQIDDSHRRPAEAHVGGSVYGFLTPRVNAARPAGEWQTMEITLLGRRVTIVHNGETTIDRQEIPGITGGALDSDEGRPGPIMVQGDHGRIDFRRITLVPAR